MLFLFLLLSPNYISFFSISFSFPQLQVLLPLNEPTFGTAKKSQIQMFLEQNGGAGLQHLVNNIVKSTVP